MKIISNRSVILTSFATLTLLISVNSQAKIYKWTDANGQVHYTAQPPAQTKKRIKATNIEDKIKAKAGKYRAENKSTKTVETEIEEESNSNNNKKEELSGPDDELLDYCNGQRNNLKQLKKNFRNVWIDAKGKKTNPNKLNKISIRFSI